jgi:hypothetical protein
MALIVGTDTLATLAELDLYWSERNDAVWPVASLANREAAARKAYDFLLWRYDGAWRGAHPGALSQTAPFPRNNLMDTEGRTITGIPRGVKIAQALLAKAALAGDLIPTRYKDGLPRSVAAGSVRVEFGQTIGIGGVYWQAEQALAGLLQASHRQQSHILIRR